MNKKKLKWNIHGFLASGSSQRNILRRWRRERAPLSRPLIVLSTHFRFHVCAAVYWKGGRKKADIIKLNQTQKDVKEGVSLGKNIKGGILCCVWPARDFLPVVRQRQRLPPDTPKWKNELPVWNWLPYLALDRLNYVTPRYALSPVLSTAFLKCPSHVRCCVMLQA
ncbi:hypothetical protein E2C01_019903 [Portunus trituberculatus]|uniref:Uncharacterized protein n=1 Tax=Portunus trituberculatus TaxID=210409 RepID=A0A5B7E0N9_PORTR|nr:hypothetical protein [Portunus trituberculatus]